MRPRHPYGESFCHRKSFFSLWILCFFAAKCFFPVINKICILLTVGVPRGKSGVTCWLNSNRPRSRGCS